MLQDEKGHMPKVNYDKIPLKQQRREIHELPLQRLHKINAIIRSLKC